LTDTKTFADFGVSEDICAALADAGITAPFPIQELTLPLGLAGADIIGQARTGTGKTLAFGIPLLERVPVGGTRPEALVIVPTRELCMQVRDDLDRAGAQRGIPVVPVYGGKSIDVQAEAIRKGAPVIVGTPGRLLDLLGRGILDLSAVTALVLDEADEMLDLGFLPDVEALIEACADDRQTLLFSATMPSAVVALARRYMRKPTFLRAEVEEARIAPETEQHFFSCHRMDKPAVLARILQTPGRGLCVVFTRTKRMADVVASELRDRGIVAAPIHSDLRQEARERAMAKFRQGTIDVLVATEVAARGLDISDVTHVVNYDCPDDEKMYLHRIGRTGRAGGSGVAVTLAVWNELARLEMIKKALDVDAPTHEVFSTSPILDELFDLPARGPRTQPAEGSQPVTRRGAPRKKRRGQPARDRRDAKPEEFAESANRESVAQEEKETTAEKRPVRAHAAAPPSRPRRARVRRRRGGDSTDRPPAAAEPVEAPRRAGDGSAAVHAGEAAPARRRVRTRTRRQPSPETAEEPTADQDERAEEGPPDRPRAQSRRAPGEKGGRRPGGDQRAPRARARKPRPDPGPKVHRENVAEVRGDGKPALRRPMAVQHLP